MPLDDLDWSTRQRSTGGRPRLRSPDGALDELIPASARVLAARDDAPIAFCHTVTAPAAVRLVLPVLPDLLCRASVAASWQVVGAIVAAFACRAWTTRSRVTVDTDPEPCWSGSTRWPSSTATSTSSS